MNLVRPKVTSEQGKIILVGHGGYDREHHIYWANAWERVRTPKGFGGMPSGEEVVRAMPLLPPGYDVPTPRRYWAKRRNSNGRDQGAVLIYVVWNNQAKWDEVIVIQDPRRFAGWVRAVNAPVTRERQTVFLQLTRQGVSKLDAKKEAAKLPYIGEQPWLTSTEEIFESLHGN